MKKLLAILLVVILGVTALAGCSTEEFKQGFEDGMKDFGEGFVEGWEEEGKENEDTDIEAPDLDEDDKEKDEFDDDDEVMDGDNCDSDGDYELEYQKNNVAVTAGFTLENFRATQIDTNLVEVSNDTDGKIATISIGTVMVGTSNGTEYEKFTDFNVNSEEEWNGYKVTDGDNISYILTTNNSMKNAKATLNVMGEDLDKIEEIVSNIDLHTWMSMSFGE